MKDLIKKHKQLIIRLAWAVTGVVPAYLLWKIVDRFGHAAAEELAQPLVAAVVWGGAGLWVFLKGK